MNYCPNCGAIKEADVCLCGYDFIEGKVFKDFEEDDDDDYYEQDDINNNNPSIKREDDD